MNKKKSNKTKEQQENNKIANKKIQDMFKKTDKEKYNTFQIQNILEKTDAKILKEQQIQQEYKEKGLIISALGQANRDATKSTLRSVKTLINDFKDEELDTASDNELSKIHSTLILVSDKIQNMKTDIDLRIKSKEKLKEELGIKNPTFITAFSPKMLGVLGTSKMFNPVPISGYYKPQPRSD